MYRMLLFLFFISLNISLFNNNLYSQKQEKNNSSKLIPSTEKNSLVVTSIPSGLKVYFDIDNDTSSAADEVELVEKHKMLSKKYYKGTTPLIIRNVKKGRYLVGISDISIFDKFRKLKMIDKNLTIRSIISFSKIPGPFDKLTEDTKGAAIYSVKINNLESNRVIVCSYPDESKLEDLDLLYDEAFSYNFDDAKVKEEIRKKMQNVLSEEEILKIINLLHRGGKISFRKGDFKILWEINSAGSFSMKH